MKVDGKAIAKEHLAKTKDANIDAEGKSHQEYSSADAKQSYHAECMRKFIEAVHSKEPHEAHKAMVEYARGEPDRQDGEGRDKHEENVGAKPSMEEEAKHYKASHFRD